MQSTFIGETFKRSLYYGVILVILQMVFFPHDGACAGSPQILYSSAKAGANSGWEQSLTKGNAITIWGYNFGTTRGTNTVTVAGVTLSNVSDYAEWGATTNPITAKGMQRITFWLNSSMANGNTSGIYVTVGGVQSNVIPFTINNACKSMFVDPVNGNDSWDGLYKDNSLGGSHGPFRSIFTLTKRASLTPGTFLYMRGGTYTNICSGCSSSSTAIIGYFETGTMYYAQQDGTDALHLTLTQYPGEHARWFNAIAYNSSNYWTFTNFTIEGNASLPEPSGNTLSWGDQWAMCTYSNGGTAWRSKGLDIIGMSFIGAHHHTVQAFGDNFKIVGNNLNMSPLGSAGTGDYTADTAYNLYLGGGDDMVIANNYISGAGYYLIHSFDENRCNSNADTNRHMHNRVIDSNWIDMNRKTSVSTPIQPRPIRAGLLIGDWSTNGGTPQVTDFHVRNNIFYSSDGLVSEGGVKLDIVSGSYNGIYIYNNTFVNASINNGPSDTGVVFLSYTSGGSVNNLFMKNNIIVGNRTYDYATQGTSETSTIQNNLLDQAWRGNGDTVSGNIVGSPGFINQAGGDFHIASTSLARNAGQNLYSSFTWDYDNLLRPSSVAWDIGAFQYGTGAPPPSNYTVGGTISGLSGTVVLQNNGADNRTLSSNGAFNFSTPVSNGLTYLVTVLSQPAGQACSVSNGSGTISGANVTTVSVLCVTGARIPTTPSGISVQ